MSARHAQLAMALQRKAIARLQSLDPAQMNAADVVRVLVESAKLERLARGEATIRQEFSGVRAGAIELVTKREQLPDNERVAKILAALADAGIGAQQPDGG